MIALFFTFTTGSAALTSPGPLIGFARNGAWLSLLISLAGGAVLLACVLFLYRKFPHLNLIEYSRQLLGKWVTLILAIPFIFVQLYSTSGIVLDVGLFMTTSMMRQTPLYIFNLLMFFVVALTARSGIEKFARMFGVIIMSVVFFIMVIVVIGSANYEFDGLRPVLPDGFKPVLMGSYFFFGVPITELILFALLLPYVRRDETRLLTKGMFLSLVAEHVTIIAVTLSTLLTFGPIAGDRTYPMFEVARTIGSIQGIESLMGYSLIITSYMKDVISLYILNITITHLFRLPDNRILIFPLALIGFLFSLIQISLGQARWVSAITVIEPLWKAFAYVLPVLILTAAAVLRKNRIAR